MKLALLTTCFAGLATASYPLIAGFGSSFAAGLGLDKPLGQVLKEQVEQEKGYLYDFVNLAEPGSKLLNISKSQVRKLNGQKPAVVYMLAGGVDVTYVACLNDPSLEYCFKPLFTEAEFTHRYSIALDALVRAVEYDPVVPIYLLTYPEAIGKETKCRAVNNHCRFTAKQFKMVTEIHERLVDYTLNAITAWKQTGNNARYQVKLIPLHFLSRSHHVTSMQPWTSSMHLKIPGDGVMWHPNSACTTAMADIMAKDLTGDRPLVS